MIYCFDLDGTICTSVLNSEYSSAKPYPGVIEEINSLYNEGHRVIVMTARGSISKKDWSNFTADQLRDWGLKYHQLIMNKKPYADFYIDDKAVPADRWRSKFNVRKGITAGNFDVIHAGYIKLFKDCKNVCDHLIVALQTDPTIDRPEKDKPIQSLEDRIEILSSIRYVDEVKTYSTEKELHELLKNTDASIRIIGSDYKNKSFTGDGIELEVYFHDRNHNRSASGLKERIYNHYKEKKCQNS